ncbi:hypothetical protein CMUS01_04419 [Colletotrichum musicola]|uniref:Uncharacterized protein n=1 Tax=Colletotrichum musicola TaxID=2175873 RepID=A0A8H6KXH0_9PEZI|nr:hypothetical protein CMUS01_04419 [Colletotrichum musicola]
MLSKSISTPPKQTQLKASPQSSVRWPDPSFAPMLLQLPTSGPLARGLSSFRDSLCKHKSLQRDGRSRRAAGSYRIARARILSAMHSATWEGWLHPN